MLGHPQMFFVGIALPAFFWSFFRASRPWLNRTAPYTHTVFWAMVVPFIIWTVAVFTRLVAVRLWEG